jgi:hypothetical protein
MESLARNSATNSVADQLRSAERQRQSNSSSLQTEPIDSRMNWASSGSIRVLLLIPRLAKPV